VGSTPNSQQTSYTLSKQADTRTLEHEIDVMIYELYGLSDEEIKIVVGVNSKFKITNFSQNKITRF